MERRCVEARFLDIVNYAICKAVNEFLREKSKEFFRRVGEYHVEEAIKRGTLSIQRDDKPLDVLVKIARYLEAMGYMERIEIKKLSDEEAIVEMQGVSVTESSSKLLKEGMEPSHLMTNLMFAALRNFNIRAELRELEYDERACRFKEYWRIS